MNMHAKTVSEGVERARVSTKRCTNEYMHQSCAGTYVVMIRHIMREFAVVCLIGCEKEDAVGERG